MLQACIDFVIKKKSTEYAFKCYHFCFLEHHDFIEELLSLIIISCQHLPLIPLYD